VTPEAVIGDMDSLSATARARLADRLFPIAEQDTTDFDKALRLIAAPFVLGLGFAGARADHGLAVLNTLARHPDRRCFIIGARDVIFLCPPEIRLDLPRGTRRALTPYYRETIARGLASGEVYEGLWENVGTPAQLQTLDQRLSAR
jgi:thiamine pyrophosphokinase